MAVTDLAGVCTGPGPCDTTPLGTGKNWLRKVNGLPAYIRAIAHSLRRDHGMDESRAIATAIATVKRWAAGGGNVSAETRARAIKAVAEWEAKKAASHALTAAPTTTIDLANGDRVYHWKHGWIPLDHVAALSKAHGSHTGAVKVMQRHGISPPGDQRARVSVRAASYRGESGHLIVGHDTHGRRVQVFAGDRTSAEKAVANIHGGRPAFAGMTPEPKTTPVSHTPAEIARGYDIHGRAIPSAATPAATSGIEITHSGDGTLVHGTTRADAPILKQNGFRWSSNLRAWYLPRNQHESTRSAKVTALEADLKAAGHEPQVSRHVGVTTTAAEREAATRARAADRATRMDTRAERASAEAQARHDRAHQIADMIPMGQPILAGHHSQRRHERDLERMSSNMDKGIAADREAKAATAAADRARATAAGDSPLLRQRRIDRNEAEIRSIDRTLAAHDVATRKPEAAAKLGVHPLQSEHHARLVAERSRLADEVAHDKAQIAASGHKAVTAADIKAGDVIHYRGRTHVVKKVNKTTVSVPTGYSWDDKVPINQITKVVKKTDLTATPARTVDLTTAAGPHRYRHGWIRIDAAAPSAIERASRAVVTDGHTLLHGRGMVAAAHKVVERIQATGHGARVRRINVAGKPHLHVARTTR